MIGVLRGERERAIATAPRIVSASVQRDRSACWCKDADQQLEQRSLARTVGTEQAIGLAGCEHEIGIAKDRAAGWIGEVEAVDRQARRFARHQITQHALEVAG